MPERDSGDKVSNLNMAPPSNFSRTLDRQLAQLPSAGMFGAALAAMGISAGLALLMREPASGMRAGSRGQPWAGFVASWVPSLLFLTVYSKLIKLEQDFERLSESQRPTVH